jgi:hypothetical protein
MIMSHLAPCPEQDEIIDTLKERNVVRRLDNVVVAKTDVLLPSGSQVLVLVEGGAFGDRVTASDAGAALICVAEAGLELDAAAYASMRRLAAKLGLSLEAGILRSEPVLPGEAAYAVVLLANGARDIAKAAFDVGRRQKRRGVRERVASSRHESRANSPDASSDRL